jgi:uncharacterized protein (TIGR04255 family)
MDALKLKDAPIIEAVIDIECDLPPQFNLEAIAEKAAAVFGDYPDLKHQFMEQYEIKTRLNEPSDYSRQQRVLSALQFRKKDGKQLIQFRSQGFSFNRLAPYGSLDEYLPEIKRTWSLYASLVQPRNIRSILLRYVNKILLPIGPDPIILSEYFNISTFPAEKLSVIGFFNQIAVVDPETENIANVILTGLPVEGNKAPIVLDISATWKGTLPIDEKQLMEKIASLRVLKNAVFGRILTRKCLSLYQPL